MLPFNLSQGLIFFDCYTLKSPHTQKSFSLRQVGTYSLIFLKANNEEKFKKIIITFDSFAHFWKKKKKYIKQILISNFLFADCSLMCKEVSANFQNKY